MKLTINSVSPFARVTNLRCELLVFMYFSLYFVFDFCSKDACHAVVCFVSIEPPKTNATVFNKFDKYYVHIVSS